MADDEDKSHAKYVCSLDSSCCLLLAIVRCHIRPPLDFGSSYSLLETSLEKNPFCFFDTTIFVLPSRHIYKINNRGLLRWAALFLGELRDGLTMINMQSAFLIVSKQYSEKQAGVLFFGTYLYCWLDEIDAFERKKISLFAIARLLLLRSICKCVF
jgi:hypothetical protein